MNWLRGVIETTGRQASAGNFDVFIDLSTCTLRDGQIGEHVALFRERSGLAVKGRRIRLLSVVARRPTTLAVRSHRSAREKPSLVLFVSPARPGEVY